MQNLSSLIRSLFIGLLFIAASGTMLGCSGYYDLNGGNLKTLHEKTFNTEPGKTLTVKASAADITVKTADNSEVYVKVLGNKRAEEKMEFSFDNGSDGVTVTAKRKDHGGWFHFGSGIALRIEVVVPKSYNVNLSSSGGDLVIGNVNGQMRLSTSGGDVSAKNTTGDLSVSTSGGDISVRSNKGSAKLGTSGGDIVCSDFNGSLDAHSSGGDIQLNGGNGEVKASTSGGEITLNYSGENKGINLRSSGGDIVINLPSDFNAQAKLYTSGGTIDCGFKGNNAVRISSNKYEADFNKGGNLLYAKTSGGDITVNNR